MRMKPRTSPRFASKTSPDRQSGEGSIAAIPAWAAIKVSQNSNPDRLLRGSAGFPLASHQSDEVHDPQSQTLLNVTDVAAQLGVSTKTIRRIIARRELPFLRIGRLIRIRQTDLLSYLKIRHISLFLLCFIFSRYYLIC